MMQDSRRKFLKTGLLGTATFGTIMLGANTQTVESKRVESNGINISESKPLDSHKLDSKSTNSNTHKGESMQDSQVWFITGASGGLGLELAKYLLERGDKVVGTSRKLSKLDKESANFLPLELNFDKNMAKDIESVLRATHKKFGRIDNVVNNAGYGLLGFVEEVSEKALRQQFEVNVFAPYLIAQNTLKIMRPQSLSQGGSSQNIKARIYNLSSLAGFMATSGSTPYSMSKFALSALSEGLALETKEFGIHTINVMPAAFRTEFFGSSAQLGDIELKEYEANRQELIQNIKNYNGKQEGNPKAFAKIIYETSRMPKPPFNLFIGENAYKGAEAKIAKVQEDMKATRKYAGKPADFS